jgi:hypothetical protein
MMTLAIDLGKFTSVACFFDTANQKHRFETIQTPMSHVEHLLATQGIDRGEEACQWSCWFLSWHSTTPKAHAGRRWSEKSKDSDDPEDD